MVQVWWAEASVSISKAAEDVTMEKDSASSASDFIVPVVVGRYSAGGAAGDSGDVSGDASGAASGDSPGAVSAPQ